MRCILTTNIWDKKLCFAQNTTNPNILIYTTPQDKIILTRVLSDGKGRKRGRHFAQKPKENGHEMTTRRDILRTGQKWENAHFLGILFGCKKKTGRGVIAISLRGMHAVYNAM